MTKEIDGYITERYARWLDYSRFQCGQARIPGEEREVLNEVLVSLLQKDCGKLTGLLHRKKDGYTELDWFVIRMIRLNVTSQTSPYRQKVRMRHVDTGTDVYRLRIPDVQEAEEDRAGRICRQMLQVREVFDGLPVPEEAKRIFAYRFFDGESFGDWQGPESLKRLYSTYKRVEKLVREKIHEKEAS